MIYRRVVPRDLFNEANLLKCYGQLYILLDHSYPEVELVYPQEGSIAAFNIEQNPASGGIYIGNVHLIIQGQAYHLERPLNSREKWPLYLTDRDDNVIPVFDKLGQLSNEMVDFLDKTCDLGFFGSQ